MPEAVDSAAAELAAYRLSGFDRQKRECLEHDSLLTRSVLRLSERKAMGERDQQRAGRQDLLLHLPKKLDRDRRNAGVLELSGNQTDRLVAGGSHRNQQCTVGLLPAAFLLVHAALACALVRPARGAETVWSRGA